MLHEKLTEDIIGAAMTGLNKLKPGLDEKLYERALALELVKQLPISIKLKQNFWTQTFQNA